MIATRPARPVTLGWQTWSVVVVVLAFVVGAGLWVLTW